MSALLQKKLKEHLEEALAALKLAGPPVEEKGDPTIRSPQVFVGDMPPKRREANAREIPCVVLVPMSGHHEDNGDGSTEAVAVIALLCVVYNPESGDAEGGEADLAALLSAITGALLPCAHGLPLHRRFVLAPDVKSRFLAWEKGQEQPRPFLQAIMTSRWHFKGWE
jgi:hypothetical protein